MKTGIEQLKCGQCGKEEHLIYQDESGSLLIECVGCESQTEVSVSPAKLKLRNHNGLGSLCKFD